VREHREERSVCVVVAFVAICAFGFSEQSLKIHIRKQQPTRPRVLMHFVDQQFRAPAESHSVAEETAGRREFDAHRQRSHQVRAGTINIPQNSHVTACFRRLACVGAL
jgi:hypothetical protein